MSEPNSDSLSEKVSGAPDSSAEEQVNRQEEAPEISADPPSTSAESKISEDTAEPEQVAQTEAEPTQPTQPTQPAQPTQPKNPEPSGEPNTAVLDASRRHTRRSFAVATLAAAAGYGFFRWATESHEIGGQSWPLRRALQANAALARAVFDERALAPTYPLSHAQDLRVNGDFGLKRHLEPDSWRLQLVGSREPARHPRYTGDVTAWAYRYNAPSSAKGDAKMRHGAMPGAKANQELSTELPRGKEEAGKSRSTLPSETPGLLLTLDDIQQLPRHEFVTQFKCIEGWSRIVHWAGVRMADFLEAYPPAELHGREPRYVYMETPNGDYYTGYNMDIMRHPQTLLVTEMMGAPLTQPHGAPLRLHMPTKYGYKQIKRIALIRYMDEKPDDYWTKLGYDWYAGL